MNKIGDDEMKRGRKSRYCIEDIETDKWKAALYIRLSSEDGDKEVSTSIESQKHLLEEFLKNGKDIELFDYYIDDGYSGTDFNRPAFKRLFDDMKLNKFNTIIVKDLSRLGRNYIEAGNYIEQIFPLFNIRFIAVNDRIDSYLYPKSINEINMPLKNLMNDEYCRDISKKITTTLKTMRKNGLFTSGLPPYGYKIDPKNKHHLIVDEETAPNVKLIFDLYLKGYGLTKIINHLNEKGILSPSGYKKFNRKNTNKVGFFWCSSTVSKILDNEMYCGDLVQGRTRKVNYKIHKEIKKPKEEWDIVKKTHEAIINRDTWEKVQELRRKSTLKFNREPRENSLFSGKIKCADCKYAMRKIYAKKKIAFNCSTYISRSKNFCKSHYITEELIKKVVLKAIKHQIQLLLDIEDILKDENKNISNDETIFYKNNISKQQNELEKYKKMKMNLYEDWKLGNISEDDYKSYLQDYMDKIEELSKKY